MFKLLCRKTMADLTSNTFSYSSARKWCRHRVPSTRTTVGHITLFTPVLSCLPMPKGKSIFKMYSYKNAFNETNAIKISHTLLSFKAYIKILQRNTTMKFSDVPSVE